LLPIDDAQIAAQSCAAGDPSCIGCSDREREAQIADLAQSRYNRYNPTKRHRRFALLDRLWAPNWAKGPVARDTGPLSLKRVGNPTGTGERQPDSIV
jgi:hypothetical protein